MNQHGWWDYVLVTEYRLILQITALLGWEASTVVNPACLTPHQKRSIFLFSMKTSLRRRSNFRNQFCPARTVSPTQASFFFNVIINIKTNILLIWKLLFFFQSKDKRIHQHISYCSWYSYSPRNAPVRLSNISCLNEAYPDSHPILMIYANNESKGLPP